MSQTEAKGAATVAPDALGTQAVTETVAKSARVYEDAPNVARVPLEDGRVGAIQRELRADGTHGPLVVAIIRKSPEGVESATRSSLADVQRVSDALGAAGHTLVRPYSASK